MAATTVRRHNNKHHYLLMNLSNLSRFSGHLFAVIVIGFGIVIGPGRAMAQNRPMGTDVSSYQGGSLNWTTIKNDGVSFAWTKATEGTYYQDADFAINEAHAKTAGVYIGAYHFARPSDDTNITGAFSADTEAAYFWDFAGSYVVAGGGYLVPMLDWEDVYVTNAGLNFTAAKLSEWANEWCNAVSNYAHAAGVTIKPVIYTGSWYSEPGTYPGLNTTVTNWPSWLSDYPDCTGDQCGSPCPQTCAPANTYPWASWNIWQYGDTNWSGGDSDVFNGSTNQFEQMFVVGNTNPPTPYAPAGVTVYWDPSSKKASPGSGGAGNWDTTTTNWWYSGTSNVAYSTGGDYAVFAGTPGTVILVNSLTADGINFDTNGYTIAGSDTLTLNSPGNISVSAGCTAYIDCVLGGVGFNLSGGGILVLDNAANYSDGETVTGPNTTLVVTTDHPAGNDGVTLNLLDGGIYQDNDTTSGDEFLLPGCAVALGSGGGVFDNPNASLTMSNYITGAGSLTFTGVSGYTLTLTDTGNNYSGGTIVNGPGTLKASAAGTLGSTSAPLTVNGGILDLGGASQTAGTVTITGGTIQDGTLTGSSYAVQGGTVSAILAGSGAVTKTTSSTATLSGSNTYTGITTITGGLLQISADDNMGAAPGSPVANKLTLNNGGISAGLRCTASFTLNANRGITLVGPNGGSIQATSGQTVTYAGIITGSGNLGSGSSYSLGYGVIVLSGANNYTGATTIAAGTLRLGANGSLPSGTPLTIGADDNTGGGGVFDLNGYSQTVGPLASSTGIGGTGTDTPAIKLTGALTILQTNVNTTFGGVISGSGGSLTLNGNGTLTLTNVNTYTGNTTISAGTLALGGTGSINSTPTISLAAGATYDVSAISSYTLSSSTTLSASGTASAATIKGGATVSLGSRPITLTCDGSHPALTISQGSLSLNGNAFTVNGSPLAAGAYTIVQQTSGSIAGSGSYSVSGTAIPATGATAAISVSGGNLILTITDTTTTTLHSLSPSTYGQSVIFTATVAPTPGGGTVQFYDNGVALGSAVTVSGGGASYTTNTLSAGSHPITAGFSGTTGYAASSTASASTQQVNQATLSITASAQSKTYGQTLAFGSGSTNFSSSGLVNGDTIGTVTLAVSGNGGVATSPVSGSPYTITPSAATGGTFTAGNYSITYNTGLLTVSPATLTVAANNSSRPYGATNPTFSVTYSNFVNGETLGTSDVAGSPALSTAANTNSPVGVYVITNSIGTLTSTNYTFNLVNGTLTVTSVSSSLVVTNLQPGPSGVSVFFNRAINAGVLTIYGSNVPVDFTLIGNVSGPVTGSLIISAQATSVTFINTGGVLAADTYTVTLESATNGFQDLYGNLLDGNGNGIPGDNYVGQFTVDPSTNRVLSLPCFARGPGQFVNIPVTNSGIPLTISEGSNVLSVSLSVQYNTNLLEITGASLGSALPAGWALTNIPGTPGILQVSLGGPVPLSPGSNTIATLTALVPWCAAYGSSGILSIGSPQLNGGAIPATGESAVEVAALLGDADGNGSYSTNDALMILDVYLELCSGFAAYPLIDPVIIGDLLGDGKITPYDAALVLQFTYGETNAFIYIPALPTPLLCIAMTNEQALISWPQCADGYVLEQSTSLGPQANWIPVTNSPVFIGDQQAIFAAPTGTQQFYRLSQ